MKRNAITAITAVAVLLLGGSSIGQTTTHKTPLGNFKFPNPTGPAGEKAPPLTADEAFCPWKDPRNRKDMVVVFHNLQRQLNAERIKRKALEQKVAAIELAHAAKP